MPCDAAELSILMEEFEVTKVPHILLVEDNPGDILLVKESFRGISAPYQLSIAKDGQQALEFMASTLTNPAFSKPDLILLDLNLPKIGGHEVLAQLKSRVEFRHIPVVILSTSDAPADIAKSYALSANCYLCKPAGLDEFFHLMRTLLEFWLKLARYTRGEAAVSLC